MSIITTDDIRIELEAMQAAKAAEFEVSVIVSCIQCLEDSREMEDWSAYDQFTANLLHDQYESELDYLYDEFSKLMEQL